MAEPLHVEPGRAGPVGEAEPAVGEDGRLAAGRGEAPDDRQAPGQATQGRGNGEERQREQEDAPGAPAVAQPTGGRDDHREADQVSHHHRVDRGTGHA